MVSLVLRTQNQIAQYGSSVCLNPTKKAFSCILVNCLITRRGPSLIFTKSGWQRTADEGSTNFMIKCNATFLQTNTQVENHETTISL